MNFADDLAPMIDSGKVFGIQEAGPDDASTYDARKLVDVTLRRAPRTAYVFVWHDPKYRLANMRHVRELMCDPRVVTRETLRS